MVLELPSYKMPSFMNALLTAKDQGFAFLKTAGTVIMAICVVMWWLNAYPQRAAARGRGAARRRPGRQPPTPAGRTALTTRPTRSRRAPRSPAASPAASAGSSQPVFAPLGYDWQLTVGVLTSFLAREVFVSTMSVLLGGVAGRRRRIRRDRADPRRRRATTARRCSRRRPRRACWSSSCWRCSACRRWR